MNSNLLDYIILALLFLITINVLMNVFGEKENMSQNLLSEEKNISQSLLLEEKNMESNKIHSSPNFNSKHVSFAPLNTNDGPVITDQVNNALDKMMQPVEVEQVDQVNQVDQSQTKPNKFTKEEILEYQDSMFEFNERINNSSAGVDMVDKINQLYTEGNNEMSGFQGKTISEVYNGLTQSVLDRKKKCVNANCLIPPIVDNLTKIESYIMSSEKDKYFRHGLLYEDDSVETGSKFYDQIEATDSEFEEHSVF
jgi:hypothetical protein